jgi:hypothetical protein
MERPVFLTAKVLRLFNEEMLRDPQFFELGPGLVVPNAFGDAVAGIGNCKGRAPGNELHMVPGF